MAKELYCHEGYGGGDNGYESYHEVIVSDQKIKDSRVLGEADDPYILKKGQRAATLTLTVGVINKKDHGNNAVLYWNQEGGGKKGFLTKERLDFAKKCLESSLRRIDQESPPEYRGLVLAFKNAKLVRGK